MNGFFSELILSVQVLKRWETLAAMAGFILIWSLFRYIALVRRRSPGIRFSLPRRQPKAAPQEPETPATQGETESEEER